LKLNEQKHTEQKNAEPKHISQFASKEKAHLNSKCKSRLDDLIRQVKLDTVYFEPPTNFMSKFATTNLHAHDFADDNPNQFLLTQLKQELLSQQNIMAEFDSNSAYPCRVISAANQQYSTKESDNNVNDLNANILFK